MSPSNRSRQVSIAAVFAVCFLFMLASPASSALSWGMADPIKELKRERFVLLKEIFTLTHAGFNQGTNTASQVHEARAALMAARLDFAETKAEKFEVAQEGVKEADEWVKQVEKLLAAGQGSRIDVLKAQVGLNDARIALAKAQAAP